MHEFGNAGFMNKLEPEILGLRIHIRQGCRSERLPIKPPALLEGTALAASELVGVAETSRARVGT